MLREYLMGQASPTALPAKPAPLEYTDSQIFSSICCWEPKDMHEQVATGVLGTAQQKLKIRQGDNLLFQCIFPH